MPNVRPSVTLVRYASVTCMLAVAIGGCSGNEPTASAPPPPPSSSSPAPASLPPISAPPSISTLPAPSLNACSVLLPDLLTAAGLRLEPPQSSAIRPQDGRDAVEALSGQDLDALYSCDAGISATAIIFDTPTVEAARASVDQDLTIASDTPTAMRTELPSSLVPFGGIVVDPEFQAASAQWQRDDLHLAVVLSYGATSLSPDAIRQLLTDVVSTAEANK